MALKLRGDTIIDEAGKTLLELTNGIVTLTNEVNNLKNQSIDINKIKTQLADVFFPVGSIVYLEVATNPKDLYGVGNWERIQGYFLLAGNDAYEQYKPGATGGAVTKTTSGHTHGLSNGYAKMNPSDGTKALYYVLKTGVSYTTNRKMSTSSVNTSYSGGDADTRGIALAGNSNSATATVDVMPPFIAVYVWKRIS